MKITNKLLIAGIVLTGLGVVSKYLLDKFLLNDTEMNFDDELELMDIEEPAEKEKTK
ncbi:MAG: hypothetical protein KAT14_01005 [Candidatus Marinimicrobia bacterium]|nr:hypothetical protein [Candidatus Neomarinimicrobiota bacterium]